mgnify:CR=1 FL=1|tara:strand:- start:118 stop:351 length:234 start_codon:yes stop_codon:yes gene_type:complete
MAYEEWDSATDTGIRSSAVYICHNPESNQHGELCSRKCLNTPNYSLEGSPFCWLLRKVDCAGDLTFEWQKQNCHFFD